MASTRVIFIVAPWTSPETNDTKRGCHPLGSRLAAGRASSGRPLTGGLGTSGVLGLLGQGPSFSTTMCIRFPLVLTSKQYIDVGY